MTGGGGVIPLRLNQFLFPFCACRFPHIIHSYLNFLCHAFPAETLLLLHLRVQYPDRLLVTLSELPLFLLPRLQGGLLREGGETARVDASLRLSRVHLLLLLIGT